MTSTQHLGTPVTVVGLGAMGSAIARTMLDHGHPTTVWNRTASRAAPLAEAGATAAPTVADAVAASPLSIISVIDYEAVEQVMDGIGNEASGKTIVNVTSGSPAQARAVQRWADEHGVDYLDGGVMGDPPDLGSDHVAFPFSGSRTAFDTYEGTLRQLGTPTYYGADAGLASVEFLAQVGLSYEVLIGLLHTLRLVQREGVDPAEFASRFADSLAVWPGLLKGIGAAVRDGEYSPDLGPLSVQYALMGDLIEHRESLGADTVRMREVAELMARRVADGHGGEGFSSLVELL